MNRYRPIVRTEAVAIGRFDHPADHVHCDPSEEVSAEYSINFVERGGFEIRAGRRRWSFEGGDVFLTHPGMSYRCRHAEAVPQDQCLSVRYVTVERCPELERYARAASARVKLARTNRMAYLRWRLMGEDDAFAAEDHAVDLLVEAARGDDGARHPRFQEHQLAWYAERVHAAQDRMRAAFGDEHRLATLARDSGMSTFHFARVFGELAGMPPHRYLLSVRLREAKKRLQEGASVTEACFACGFRNLSHFTRTYRRHFGDPPSRRVE